MRLPAIAFGCLAFTGVLLLTQSAASPTDDPRLGKASRLDGPNGWIRVRLEGTPSQIGYQHGFLLAREIADIRKVAELELTHDSPRDWAFFRKAATEILWPRIDEEYKAELKGIAEGATAAGVKIDATDVTVINAMIEFGYYTAWLDKKKNPAAKSGAQERCSAFVATGQYTRDGRIVIAHNNWTAYLDGARWNVIFDIRPARILSSFVTVSILLYPDKYASRHSTFPEQWLLAASSGLSLSNG